MKMNKVLAALCIAGVCAPQFAFATNGDTMMAVGSQNTALGGSGVAHFVGAESTFANPAMLGKSKQMEVTGGVVYFKPTVTNTGFTGTTAVDSSASPSVIPDVSFSNRLSNNLVYGVAMAGIAGMGVDYTGASASYVKAKTTMSILKIVPTIAYNDVNYGVGISPVLQYGSLAISYTTQNGATNSAHNADTDTGYGFALGGYFNPSPELTLAAAYNSSIAMTYGKQLSIAGQGFNQTFADKLDQPAEIKAGVAYAPMDGIMVTADYRMIQWGSAKGYKEFGWKDQAVVALGAKYSANGYWLGVGYNMADNPIGTFTNGTMTPANNNGGIVNMFNNLLFPGIIKSAMTFGGGFDVSKELAVEVSGAIAPKVTTTVDISDAQQMSPGSLSNTTTHSQQSYSVSLRYKF